MIMGKESADLALARADIFGPDYFWRRLGLGLGLGNLELLVSAPFGRTYVRPFSGDAIHLSCRHEPEILGKFNSAFEGGIFVDIGAYLGGYSLHMLSKAKRIIALEPFAPIYRRLARNVSLNDSNRKVLCLPYAVDDHNGEAKFSIPIGTSEHYKRARLDQSQYDYFGSVPRRTAHTIVSVRRLKTLVSQLEINRIELVKFDIEGTERRVLEDSVDLFPMIDKLLIEIHHAMNAEPIKRLLEQHGYETSWVIHRPETGSFYIFAKRYREQNALGPEVDRPDRTLPGHESSLASQDQ